MTRALALVTGVGGPNRGMSYRPLAAADQLVEAHKNGHCALVGEPKRAGRSACQRARDTRLDDPSCRHCGTRRSPHLAPHRVGRFATPPGVPHPLWGVAIVMARHEGWGIEEG